MSSTKELLLIQLAHAKQATTRAKNNRYSDLRKQRYQEALLSLFDKVEEFVNGNLELFNDDTQIYDGPKRHLDFIFKSLEFLDNSTLNQIPYEIVACLEQAMTDWLETDDKFIIVTSLINDVSGFSYERWLAIDDVLYQSIEAKYPEVKFEHRLVQINLPRAFSRDYLATVVLYHELGHFVDHKYKLIQKTYYSLLLAIEKEVLSDHQLNELKIYLPELTAHIDNDKRPDFLVAAKELVINLRHLSEYFCDLFAAQYIGGASNLYVTYLGEGGANYNESHPSSVNRQDVVTSYQDGKPNVIVQLINAALEGLGRSKLERKYEELPNDEFLQLIPPVVSNPKELHGILTSAWQLWLTGRKSMLSRLNTADNSKCYTAINNLVEKAIGNYIAVKEWNKAMVPIDNGSIAKVTSELDDVDIPIEPSGAFVRDDILASIDAKNLIIRPLLSNTQIGEVTIDFRLGYDFLVSVQGRDAFINASKNEWVNYGSQRNVHNFFQSTRRQIGETFILHPHQTVLAVTLEYVKLPEDAMLELFMRSSYARLGITINTMAQPGYAGCLNLELTNNNNNPINLAVGARIIQGVLRKLSKSLQYFRTARKYVCQVRPEPSAITQDADLDVLNNLWSQNNNRVEEK